MDTSGLGKLLVAVGLFAAGIGLVLILGGKGPFGWIGRLPGDFYFKGKNFSFYFPLATGLLASVILTLILWLINRR
jgi:hypothetical protein